MLVGMTLDDALRDLATTGNELPRDAMRWALDHWDESGPRFVALLNAYASGADRSEQTERALFLVIHLLGEKAEAAAFGPLCRLLLDGEASDLILGDAITSTLRGILISTYDGDLAALQAVIEAQGADDFVREGALLALAYLARTGRVPEAGMRSYLLRLLAEMQPQAEHFVCIGWLLAVAHLGSTQTVRYRNSLKGLQKSCSHRICGAKWRFSTVCGSANLLDPLRIFEWQPRLAPQTLGKKGLPRQINELRYRTV